VPIREMSESELDEVYRSFERAGVMLTPADKAALKREVWEVADSVRGAWLVWKRTPRQMEKEMRSVANLARLLQEALGKPPDGDWLEAEQTPIIRLPYDLSFVWSESGRRGGSYPDTFERSLRTFCHLLNDVALAAERRLSRGHRVKSSEGANWSRGRDMAVKLFIFKLNDIWLERAKRKVDAWVDSDTGEYRGNFWYFVRASAVLCREFMGEKATDGALFSRLDRLIREQKKGLRSTTRQSK
jgi:hypothetical protein